MAKKSTTKEISVKKDKKVNECSECKCGCCCCTCKGKFVAIVVLIAVLIAGIVLGCSCCHKNKVAIVDVVTLLSKSAQFQELKVNQEKVNQELNAWRQQAQAIVDNEQDATKKAELLKSYNAEFLTKREDIKQKYNEKLQELDRNITQMIVNEAQKKGYQLVVAKSSALYGATDITEELIKVMR